MRRGVLLTRPEPGARATAARLAALGYTPVLAPLLVVRPRPFVLPDPARVQAIVAASGHAVDALPSSHLALPLLAVGAATAARARAAGCAQVRSADGDAQALAALAARHADPAGKALLLLCGAGQGAALAASLRGHGFAVIRRVTYAARPVARLPEPARAALAAGTLAAALFFSAETARAFARLARGAALAGIEAITIGRPAAMALEGLGFRAVRIAAKPNQDAMLALLPPLLPLAQGGAP